MKALVTDGAGFIGSHLVDRLARDGHEIKVIHDPSTGRLANIDHHHTRTGRSDPADAPGAEPGHRDRQGWWPGAHRPGLPEVRPSSPGWQRPGDHRPGAEL